MDYALMFDVKEGGVSEPIKWGKENLSPDRNIIILDEGSSSLYLWHGAKQGLVARRTALRQAESLKGHGYTIGKSIIGRDIRDLKEIDQRKVGRDPETDKLNEELQIVLNSEYKELDHFIVTFEMQGKVATISKSEIKHEPKPETKLEPVSVPASTSPPPKTEPSKEPVPTVKSEPDLPKPEMKFASEYSSKPESLDLPKQNLEPTPSPPILQEPEMDLSMDAKVGFIIMGIMDHYTDIWISKKDDGVYAVEHMDGKICEFSASEGKIKFSPNSFSGISTNIKTEIQKKFVELSKLI
jgi:hypothetical protein